MSNCTGFAPSFDVNRCVKCSKLKKDHMTASTGGAPTLKCPKCGNESNAKFCPKCSTKMDPSRNSMTPSAANNNAINNSITNSNSSNQASNGIIPNRKVSNAVTPSSNQSQQSRPLSTTNQVQPESVRKPSTPVAPSRPQRSPSNAVSPSSEQQHQSYNQSYNQDSNTTPPQPQSTTQRKPTITSASQASYGVPLQPAFLNSATTTNANKNRSNTNTNSAPEWNSTLDETSNTESVFSNRTKQKPRSDTLTNSSTTTKSNYTISKEAPDPSEHDISTSFDLYDSNGDKKLDLSEAAGALRSLGFYPTSSHMSEIQRQNNGITMFNRQQFVAIVNNQRKLETNGGHRTQLIEAFACFDRNDSGKVDMTEVNHLMKTFGDILEDHEIQSLWEVMESDGSLDYRKVVQ